MIGIGITTRNRFNVLGFSLQKFIRYCNGIDTEIIILDDYSDLSEYEKFKKENKYSSFVRWIRNESRLGIAKSKNILLKEFLDRKYEGVILFDDDSFPYKDGWLNHFIDAWTYHGQHHLVYACNAKSNTIRNFEYATSWGGCQGVCIWLSSYAIRESGGFNEQFGLYGYEHVEFTNRCFKLGLSPLGRYVSPRFVSDYIYCFDAYGSYNDDTTSFTWSGSEVQSMTREEKNALIEENRRIAEENGIDILGIKW